MVKKYSLWFFVAIVVLCPIIAFTFVSWYGTNFSALPVYGDKGHSIADFEMTNQYGKTVTANDWQGKIVVVDFFFSHCPVICPKMTRNLKTVQQEFENDQQVRINSFTVDPERDSVSRLAFYAAKFAVKGNWNLLTGEKTAIYRLARKSFQVVATDGDGGPGDFIHSDKLVLVDMQKRIRGYYDGTNASDIGQLIKDIRKLQAEAR